MSKKTTTARLSVYSNSFLIAIKAIVGFAIGSVSIISEAMHSTMDLLASVINFYSVKMADRKPDNEHPYGHGKFENISGVIEALLIFFAAGWIIYEAIERIVNPKEIEHIGIGFIVMLGSAIINFFVSRRLYKVARETDSIALEADALHLKTDIYTSLGIAIGLLLMWITGYRLLDSIAALMVAVLIIRQSYLLLIKAFSPLLDTTLPDEELNIIKEAIARKKYGCIDFHQLRSRKAGNMKYVDLHLVMPQDYSVKDSHAICDAIEKEIESYIKNIEVHIHVEPCNKTCETCEQFNPTV
jgi:cation diffusion facilitator family transporter